MIGGNTAYLLADTPGDTDRWTTSELRANTRKVDRGTYTPTYTATTTTPVLGSTGFIRGSWFRVGLKISGWIDLSYAGTGIVFGGTAITTGLPFAVDSFMVAGALNAASLVIGSFMTQSTVSADATSGRMILAGLSGPPRMLMYGTGSTTSKAGTMWTGTSGRLKIRFKYIAAASEFP